MRRRRHQAILLTAILGVACRALIPVGFMPASFAEGGPVAFCQSGPVGELLQALGEHRTHGNEHHDHSHHGQAAHPDAPPVSEQASDHDADAGHDAGHDAWDRCPLGFTASLWALAAAAEWQLPGFTDGFARIDPPVEIPAVFAGPYLARAPPDA